MGKMNFWNNGSRIWIWILIGAFIIGAISQFAVTKYENKETCKRSLKNEEKNTEQDAKLADHETRIQVTDTKLDNIQKTVDGIDSKLDRALRRR